MQRPLTEDIDLSGVEWQPIGHMDLTDMSNYSCMFFGTFDGQGHTVSNVTFNSDYPVCGVGVVGMNCGEVKNLTVENVQIRCTDTFSMAVGGVVGIGLYYYGEETAFKISNCTVDGEIVGAVTPGAVAGRAENSVIESCETSVTLDGEALSNEVGETLTMYESADQGEEEPAA